MKWKSLAITPILFSFVPFWGLFSPKVEVIQAPPMPYSDQVILADLTSCESGGNERAINPLDKDGTASYGLLQFKPDTLYSWGKEFNITPDLERQEVMNVIYDGQLQTKIFLAAFHKYGKSEAWWHQQFPGCYNRYGKKWQVLLKNNSLDTALEKKQTGLP